MKRSSDGSDQRNSKIRKTFQPFGFYDRDSNASSSANEMELYFSDAYKLSAKRVPREDLEEEELPTELDTIENLNDNAEVSLDKLSFKYSGQSQHQYDVGTVQANYPAPIECLAYYFEICVKNAGGNGEIAVGFTRKRIGTSGSQIDGCAYSGHSGLIYRRKGQNITQAESQAYTTGDIVGSGINYVSQEFFFTKNGEPVCTFPKDLTGPLYPTVVAHSLDSEVTINFGKEKFAYDFKEYEALERKKQQTETEKIPISPSISRQLVKNYLLHYGYGDTLKALDLATESAQQEGGINEQKVSYALQDRKILRELIMKGEIDAARTKLSESYPKLVENDKSGICFLLGCQEFIEMIRKGEVEKAVKCGREKLEKFFGLAPFQDIVKDCTALAVHDHPEDSPVGYFLGEMQKEVVADAVNAGILSTDHNNKHQLDSCMERVLKQLTICSDVLLSQNQDQGDEPFSLDQFLNQKH